MKSPKRVVLLLCVLCALCGVFSPGCITTFSGKDQAVVDHRAAVLRALANDANARTLPPSPADWLTYVWTIENEARAAQNLSDAAHWQKPTFPCPASMPAAVPWTPRDDVSAGSGK